MTVVTYKVQGLSVNSSALSSAVGRGVEEAEGREGPGVSRREEGAAFSLPSSSNVHILSGLWMRY